MLAANYAKNTVKHLRKIIDVLAGAEILAEGVISLQSMDEETLTVIRRSNIKLERYNELSSEFRRNQLPLAVDVMMGLPGSTLPSFRRDLQECMNRDVRARVHPTTMLANSPMNDPEYRAEHKLEARAGEIVDHAGSFTREDYARMDRLRTMFLLGDSYAILRYVAKWVRSRIGRHEVDFFEGIVDDLATDPDRFPVMSYVLGALYDMMVQPCSWKLFIDDLRRYLVEVLGIDDDDELATVLAVQHAMLPSPDRTFPLTLELPHDFEAWHSRLLDIRDQGHREDWEEHAPRLNTYGPATMTVDDPDEVCRMGMGLPLLGLSMRLVCWELGSSVARPRVLNMRQG
jgi:hypothetical protein